MLATMARPKKTAGDKKKSRGPVLFIQLTEDEEHYLMSFIRAQPVEPDRSAVGKVALRKFLQEMGHWPIPPKTA